MAPDGVVKLKKPADPVGTIGTSHIIVKREVGTFHQNLHHGQTLILSESGIVDVANRAVTREVSTLHHGQTLLLSESGISQAGSDTMPFVKTPTSSLTGNLSSCSSLPHSLISERYHYYSD